MSRQKDAIMDFTKHMDKRVRVKFVGGREVVGTLKGHDKLVNLVLDDSIEYMRDPEDPTSITDTTRHLGLVVCRGVSVMLVAPEEGYEEIENPFLDAVEDEYIETEA